MPQTITIHQKVVIDKPKEIVWDYTQELSRRNEWDRSILEAIILEEHPKTVQLNLKRNNFITVIYKLDNRPNKSSYSVKKTVSSLIEYGGGSWHYEERGGTTLWTQSNTVVLKQSLLNSLLFPVYSLLMNIRTKKAMVRAKRIIEREYTTMDALPEQKENVEDETTAADSVTGNEEHYGMSED